VLFNTGSGLKYIDVIADALKISVGKPQKEKVMPAARNLGGIIQPN